MIMLIIIPGMATRAVSNAVESADGESLTDFVARLIVLRRWLDDHKFCALKPGYKARRLVLL